MNNQAQAMKTDCPVGQVMVERTDTHSKRLDKNELDHQRIWEAIDSLRNRLPNWAVFLIAALTAICGWLSAQLRI